MDLREIADDIPNYEQFLTIDELNASSHRLAEEFPDLVSIRVVGNTRAGDPIEMITIKGGSLQALVFGGPHPNEPIGTMTIEYLSRRLCEDAALREELGYTWNFIKSIDSDGMRLNEGWFKGPFTPTNYARKFFRPAPFDQVEWTFPIDYKTLHFHSPLPETETLMAVIDELKPTLLYSLHNAGFGGVYYYVQGGDEALFKQFHEIPTWFNLALDLGEPEVSYAVQLAPAVYKWLSISADYDHLLANGIEDPATIIKAGSSSAEYASKYGSYFLVVELPYYDDPRVNDPTVTDILRRDAIIQSLDAEEESEAWFEKHMNDVKEHLQHETLVSRATISFLEMGKSFRGVQRQWAMTAEETNRLATQAEVFSSLLVPRFYRLLIFGMFVRMLEDEVNNGNTSEIVAETRDLALARFDELSASLESALNYRVLPIQSMVGVQVCAGLATAAYLRDQKAQEA